MFDGRLPAKAAENSGKHLQALWSFKVTFRTNYLIKIMTILKGFIVWEFRLRWIHLTRD